MKNTNKNFSIFFVRGDPVKTLFNNFHKGPLYVKIFRKILFVFFIRHSKFYADYESDIRN